MSGSPGDSTCGTARRGLTWPSDGELLPVLLLEHILGDRSDDEDGLGVCVDGDELGRSHRTLAELPSDSVGRLVVDDLVSVRLDRGCDLALLSGVVAVLVQVPGRADGQRRLEGERLERAEHLVERVELDRPRSRQQVRERVGGVRRDRLLGQLLAQV